MIIKSVKFNLKKYLLFIFIIVLISIMLYLVVFNGFNSDSIENVFNSDSNSEEFMNQVANICVEDLAKDSEKEKSYIKWVDFKGTAPVLKKLSDLDISSHTNNEPVKLNWIELMAYLSCKYGGDLSLFKQSDLDSLVSQLREGKTMEELTSKMKLYNYFYQSYDAIFHEYLGEYEIQSVDSSR